MNSGCSCSRDRAVSSRSTELVGGTPRIPLATAFVTFQKFGEVYSPCEGLKRGTIFPCLFKPYKQ